ncbi:MAG: cupin domain-containing protein [Planctomycetes bacterium]|nr:cupin domain-containing protein [Planctomycetota bacterium]
MTQTVQATRYRWDDLEIDRPMALLTRKRIIGEQMMISHVLLEKGCTVASHAHENEQFACVVSGRIRFGLGDENSSDYEQVELVAGEVLHLPSNVLHSAEAIEDTLILDLFSPPSEKTGIDKN